MSETGVYDEVRDGITRLFGAEIEDPLGQFGFADLLAAEDAPTRSAAFAVAEAQGRAGSATDVVSRIALAGVGASAPTAYAMRLGHSQSDGAPVVGLLGSRRSVDALVVIEAAGLARVASLGELTPIASPLDPDYLSLYSCNIEARPFELASAEDVQARARIACAAEILGACEAMLADAIGYTRARRQFGSPLVTFQSVAHALAWVATEIHQLRALLRACLSGDALRAPDRLLATAVKALAGTVGKRVAQSTLQVTGGMGFTWEYSHNALHRRVLALDAVAGSADALHVELGRYLRQGRDAERADLAPISLATLATLR